MKIALVATGGTIGSRVDSDGVIRLSDAATDQIANAVGATRVFDSFKIHSEKMEFADLNEFRRIIEAAQKSEPDAIVVSHGTDTLAFSSAYLAYAFSSTRIPIVICAADAPLTEHDSNGFDILQSTKTFLRTGKPGVYVVYKNPEMSTRIHHAARLMPAHLHEHYYFSIGDSVFHDSGLMRDLNFDIDGRKAISITPYVGLDYSAFNVDGMSAVVHSAYHSGTVNAAALNAFAEAHPELPIYLTVGKRKYAGQDFAENIVPCYGITQNSLYIKVLIGLKNNIKDLPAFVRKNAVGEIVE